MPTTDLRELTVYKQQSESRFIAEQQSVSKLIEGLAIATFTMTENMHDNTSAFTQLQALSFFQAIIDRANELLTQRLNHE